MAPDYLEFYKTLDLPSTASWDEVKLAYRRQVQLWHPDRHQDSSEEVYKESSEKFLAVTSAFEQLQRYYKEHGKLPTVAEKPRPQVSRAENVESVHASDFKVRKTRRKSKRKGLSIGRLAIVLFAGGISVIAIILLHDFRERQQQQERYNANKSDLSQHKSDADYNGVYWLENINSDLKNGSTLGTSSESVGDTMNRRMNETRQ